MIGHTCVADEHFVPTLLTAYGMADTLDHVGLATFSDWWSRPGDWHPRIFLPGDAPAKQVVHYMRSRVGPAKCGAEASCAFLWPLAEPMAACFCACKVQ
jgi:hypothetical protein